MSEHLKKEDVINSHASYEIPLHTSLRHIVCKRNELLANEHLIDKHYTPLFVLHNFSTSDHFSNVLTGVVAIKLQSRICVFASFPINLYHNSSPVLLGIDTTPQTLILTRFVQMSKNLKYYNNEKQSISLSIPLLSIN